MNTLKTISGIDLVREQLEAFNTNDWEALKRTCAPEAVYREAATGIVLKGPENIAAGLKMWKASYPDLKGVVTEFVGNESLMAVELTWEGTFMNDLPTAEGLVKATGTHAEVQAAQFYTIEDGRITALHHYFDLRSALR